MATMPSDLAVENIAPDEPQVIEEFIAFLEEASRRRHPTGPIRRFNQGRHTACVTATLTVLDRLPAEFRVGVFSVPRSWRAWIRFANATSSSDRNADVRGMSIKLFDVGGPNLTEGATTQDFILNSHPVMMVPHTRDFLELLKANESGRAGTLRYFLSHPKAARLALAARSKPTCHLDIPFWSTTPYRFGPGRAVKYVVRPSSCKTSRRPFPLTDSYLRDALAAHLRESEATFDFMVQLQTDPEKTPIEDASIEWKEEDSPPTTVARLVIPRQLIDTPPRDASCEAVSFNPWNCLPDHQPLGSFNRARREIYRALARLRSASAVDPAALGEPELT
jgi:hypothetical protein